MAHQKINKIFVRTHGGLGNQLFQVFHALLKSNRHESKLFLWHDDRYYHKFKLADCFRFIKSPDIIPMVLRFRIIKILNKLRVFGHIQMLSFWSNSYLDGYFQNIEIYSSFNRLEKEKILNLFRNIFMIEESNNGESLLHLRLGDFFSDDGLKINQLDEMLRNGCNKGCVDCITNEEKLVKERIQLLQIDLRLISTQDFTPAQLLRLMSSYKRIVSNGSTLATWAAILGCSNLASTDDQVKFAKLFAS